jgi:Leucine-rich repeat (LRR) protein
VPPGEGLVADSTELRVLRQFYAATGGPQWTTRTNWLTGTTLAEAATWHGVTVGGGDVTQLTLAGNGLRGPLPAGLGRLARLEILNLNHNQLTGSLPAAWGALGALRLVELSNNQLSGPLPAAFGQCTSVSYLDLSRNGFTGSLQVLASLPNLSITNESNNQFSGPVPAELGQLTRLNYLYLDNNLLSGSLPATLGASSNLIHLHLAGNRLSGTLPAAVLARPALRSLALNNNDLTGVEDLTGATGMSARVDLPGNLLDFGGLERLFQGPGQARTSAGVEVRWQRTPPGTDTVAYVIGDTLRLRRPMGGERTRYQWQRQTDNAWVDVPGAVTSRLAVPAAGADAAGLYRVRATNDWATDLTLYSKAVYAQPNSEGLVPDATELAALRALYNSTNGANWTTRTNWLTGTTLAEAGTWYGVTVRDGDVQALALAFNQLSGSLPAELGQLTQLRTLNLYNNRLVGKIPNELGQLNQLTQLILSSHYNVRPGEGNALTGGIPAALGQLANLTFMDLGLNPLGGTIPPELGQLTKLTFLQLDDCRLSGAVPAQLLALPALTTLILGNQNVYYRDYNQLSSLPDPAVVTNRANLRLKMPYNQLEFGDLEPYFQGVGQLITQSPFGALANYVGQTLPTEEQLVEVTAGEAFTLRSDIGGTRTRYQWQKEQAVGTWTAIAGATSATYQVAQASAQDQGLYRCQATNDWVTDLTLYSRPQRVKVGGVLPPSDPSDDLDRNWSMSRSFDGNDNVIGEGKSFSDGLGRTTQTQVKSKATKHVLATQTVYNSGGKPALSTLVAPIYNQEFKYKDNFLTSGGTNYRATNFEDANASNPSAVDQPATPGSVGYYYSSQNTLEPLTATTNYPFSLSEEYGGPLGGMKRATGPGDQFRMGLGREAKGREFTLLNELDHYLSLRSRFIPGSSATSLRAKGEKAVSINVDGRESISFSDADGKLLATCLTGPQYSGLTLTAPIHANPANADGLPQYQDIHVPAAGAVTLNVQGSGAIRVVNLLTEVSNSYEAPWPSIRLEPGFYRVISERDNQEINYLARYGDFSYSYYDDAGRVVATIAPKGVAQRGAVRPLAAT